MNSINLFIQWSCFLSGLAGLMSVSLVVASWFAIEMLAFMISLI